LNQNSDVFLGYIAWSAGSFDSNYILSLTPTQQNGKFVDNSMVSQCVVAPWNIYEGATVTSLVPTTTALVKSSVDKSNSAATPTSSVKSISTPTTLNIGTVFSRSDKSSTMTKTTLDSVGSTMNSLITTTTPQSTNYAFTSSQTTINNPIESTINNTPQLPASMANKRAVGVGMLAVGFTVVVLL
jgi:endoglucanase